MFSGLLAVVIAALLPNWPNFHSSPLGYPIVWEIIAAGLFAIAYGAIILAIVQPVHIHPNRVIRFVRSSAWLLSSATERDYLDFAQDLERSLPVLIKTAAFADHRRETSAFFVFRRRKNVERARYRKWLHAEIIPRSSGRLLPAIIRPLRSLARGQAALAKPSKRDSV